MLAIVRNAAARSASARNASARNVAARSAAARNVRTQVGTGAAITVLEVTERGNIVAAIARCVGGSSLIRTT